MLIYSPPGAIDTLKEPLILTGQSNWLKIMKQIQASAAKAHLSELLDDVERGETIAITRHGKRIARIVPEDDAREREIRQAMADIEEIRKLNKPATREEILAWRDEGRK